MQVQDKIAYVYVPGSVLKWRESRIFQFDQSPLLTRTACLDKKYTKEWLHVWTAWVIGRWHLGGGGGGGGGGTDRRQKEAWLKLGS